MLLLFDIDGTLIRCGGAGRAALNAAILELHGAENVMKDIRLAGGTDYAIFDQIFEAHFGRLPHDISEIQDGLNCYLKHLKRELAEGGDRFEILPGAVEAIDRLEREPDFMVGLATGNVEEGARLKLEHAHLWHRFEFGGYGSDAKTRVGLVQAGVKRANQIRESQGKEAFKPEEIYVIGDTEFDVRSAHDLGFRSIGVRIGSFHVDVLEQEKPSFMVDSLEDSQFWSAIGLDPA